MALTVTETGAHLEFDCATGAIDRRLVADDRGMLLVDGVYRREGPGPQRVDAQPEPARYSGKIVGSTLTFAVTLTESNQSVGPFVVTLGRLPHVVKCL